MSPAKNRELTLIATAGILAVFAAVDYYTPAALYRPSMGGPQVRWLGLGGVGICIAQVTLIGAWAVFAPGNIVVRLPWSLLLGLTTWYLLVFGQRQVFTIGGLPHYSPQDTLVLGIVLLLGATVLQIPLWIAKRVFRYRMFKPGEIPAPAARVPFQFQVMHLLMGTFILSAALSPIRLVLPKETVGSLMSGRQLSAMSVVISAAMVVNLVATLPCLWGGFVSSHRVGWLGVAWSVYSFVVTVIEYGVLCAALGGPGDANAFWAIALVNFMQGAVVFAVMRIYRTIGYRLQRLPRGE